MSEQDTYKKSDSQQTSSIPFLKLKNGISKLFSSSSSTGTHSVDTDNANSTKKKTKLISMSNNIKRIPFNTKSLVTNNADFKLNPNELTLIEFKLKKSLITNDYGFTVIGYCPCQIGKIEYESSAYKSGLLVSDIIYNINGRNVSRATKDSIVKLINKSPNDLLTITVYRNANSQKFYQNINDANNYYCMDTQKTTTTTTNSNSIANTTSTNNITTNSLITISTSNNYILPIGKIICQGDQASMGIINSTENDFLFLSKTSTNNNNNNINNNDNNTNNANQGHENFLNHFIQATNSHEIITNTNKLNTIESFKSEDFIYYAGGNGVSIQSDMWCAKEETGSISTNITNATKKIKHYYRSMNSKQTKPHKIKRKTKLSTNTKLKIDVDSNKLCRNNELPSPIPYLPPLSKINNNKNLKNNHFSDIEINYEYVERNDINNCNSNGHSLLWPTLNSNEVLHDNVNVLQNRKGSALTDSDYKTQSSSTTDIGSASNDYKLQNNQSGNDEFENEYNNDEYENDRMEACEQLLNLEEQFIDNMQKGVQQYSRPLRHCMMINASQHHILFQNIEKILAISEYQLNQLISQENSILIDMFNSIGKLYENKMRMSCEAFDIYLNGVDQAFILLDNLIRTPNFSKFIQDSKEDIDMDLRTFLLLPLTYVGSVYECLCLIRDKTNKTNSDYISLNTVLQSLSVYVKKSKICLNKYISSTTTSSTASALKDQMNNEECDEEYEENENIDSNNSNSQINHNNEKDNHIYNSHFLIYSSKLYYKNNKNKWIKIYALLFNDTLAFMSKNFDEDQLANINNFSSHIKNNIYLKDILKYNFDSNNNEFQLIYSNKSTNTSNNYYSIRLKAFSIEEKHTWKKLLTQHIQKSKKFVVP